MNTNRFLEEYSATLSQQKRIIRTNVYARELEERYHKNCHKPPIKGLNIVSNLQEASFWPIESPVFNEVLKSKLRNLSTKAAPPFGIGRKVLTELKRNYQFRFQSENYNLPRVDKSRFWSPPKAVTNFASFKEKEPKEFGPKVKQIQCIQKSSILF